MEVGDLRGDKTENDIPSGLCPQHVSREDTVERKKERGNKAGRGLCSMRKMGGGTKLLDEIKDPENLVSYVTG